MTDASGPLVVTAIFRPAEGAREQVLAAMQRVIPRVHEEEGCNLYAIQEAEDGTIAMIEHWDSAALLDAHGAAEPVADFNAELEGLLAVLDPDAVLRIDGAARIAFGAADAAGTTRELRGASTWATQMIALSRGQGLRFVQPALINGSVGVILAPRGKLSRALMFTVKNDNVTELDVIGDPARLRELEIAVL